MKTYLEITKIHLADPTPQTGDTVWVSVMVKNLTSSPVTALCNVTFNGTAFIHFTGQSIVAGLTFTFGGFFTMPAENVAINAYVHYLGGDGLYHLDDELIAFITGQPGEVPPELPPGEGDYLEITDTVITPNPQPGATVWVTVKVRNNHTAAVSARCLANLDILTYFIAQDVEIASGATYSFSGWFIMPTTAVIIHAYAYHLATDGLYYLNDYSIVDMGATPIERHQLLINILPAVGGKVSTAPASDDYMKYLWDDKDTGLFLHGTNVRVTALPNQPAWKFEKWTGDIVGGLSYLSPSYVQTMMRPRVVNCHFIPNGDENGNGDGIPGVKIKDYLYPLASTYKGDAEKCTFTFSLGPDEIPGTEWYRDQIINNFTSEVEKEGAQMLQLEVYEDTSPALTTDYTVIATSTASPVPWLLIIGAIMLLLFLIPIVFVIVAIVKFVWAVGEAVFDLMGDIIPLLIVVLVMTMMMKMMGGVIGEKKPSLIEERRPASE